MPRIEINFPDEKTVYKTQIPVLVNHLNYGNHLGHDSALSILQEARARFLRKHGMTEIKVEGNIGLLVTEAALTYKSEAFYGDILEIELAVSDITKTSCDTYYKVTNIETGKIVTLAKIGITFFDFENKKISKVPDRFSKALF